MTEEIKAIGITGNCGEKIAEILRKRYPKAIVYPLRRSAIAIQYLPDKKHVKIITSGDPHVWGQDITEENVTEERFRITGDRFFPLIFKEDLLEDNNFNAMTVPYCHHVTRKVLDKEY